jgi:hypothetical protein
MLWRISTSPGKSRSAAPTRLVTGGAVAGLLFAASLMLAGSAQAHHSFSAFDGARTLSMTGTVKDWQWTNPHTWLVLVAMNGNDTEEEWNIEGQSPQVLRREQSMPRDVIKAGDKVTVTIHPRRDGSHGGSLVAVITVNGHEPAHLAAQ